MSKSLKAAADLQALCRARNPLIWIVTREEFRVEPYIFEAANSSKFAIRCWDCAQGVTDVNGTPLSNIVSSPDVGEALAAISDRARSGVDGRCLWVFRDLPGWLQGPGGMLTVRQLRNLCKQLRTTSPQSAYSIVVISPDGNVPQDLQGHATVIEWPLPDREEIAAVLDAIVAPYSDDKVTKPTNGQRDAAIDAAIGLSGAEAEACYARSIVQLKSIDPSIVANEKKRVIARERILEWYDPLPGGLEAVGGLDVLKSWLVSRRLAYSPKARAYGLPAPRGVLLVGVPGCGKSLTAKAIATAWGVPLIRLDMGALKSKFVGESEQNLRKAFRIIESVGRCVVWIDEIEKALAGATQGAADGGVSADALGAVLSWMQEHQGESFVVATANDVSALPPELLRKGRFDELFFVDLPNTTERTQILAATLKKHGRGGNGAVTTDALAVVAERTEGFTGAELSELVPEALFAAFADNGREITVADIATAAAQVVPLSKTASDKVQRLRDWAKGRARLATSTEAATSPQRTGSLDV
jgi:hypothetical protein